MSAKKGTRRPRIPAKARGAGKDRPIDRCAARIRPQKARTGFEPNGQADGRSPSCRERLQPRLLVLPFRFAHASRMRPLSVGRLQRLSSSNGSLSENSEFLQNNCGKMIKYGYSEKTRPALIAPTVRYAPYRFTTTGVCSAVSIGRIGLSQPRGGRDESACLDCGDRVDFYSSRAHFVSVRRQRSPFGSDYRHNVGCILILTSDELKKLPRLPSGFLFHSRVFVFITQILCFQRWASRFARHRSGGNLAADQRLRSQVVVCRRQG